MALPPSRTRELVVVMAYGTYKERTIWEPTLGKAIELAPESVGMLAATRLQEFLVVAPNGFGPKTEF